MTTQKAKNKIEKATGTEMTKNQNGLYYTTYNERFICFYANGQDAPDAEITCIHTSRVNQDPYNKHVTYHSNIKQALDFVK